MFVLTFLKFSAFLTLLNIPDIPETPDIPDIPAIPGVTTFQISHSTTTQNLDVIDQKKFSPNLSKK